jgi:type II secretory pathway predicted ATPase ExeA
MYEAFFELDRRPFPAAPIADYYFPAASIETARRNLARCIERGEGPALLISAAGLGKSMLCAVLRKQFEGTFATALLSNTKFCSRRALLQTILFELGLPYKDMQEGELRLSLIDHVSPGNACPNGLLLIVDEAHTLPARLLEELRLATNLVRDDQPRVRLMLAGGPALEERLASPKLESFNQRIAARCYLDSMNRDETFDFVRSGIVASGGDPEAIFGEDALKAVYNATDGVPRLINQLADHALMMAALGERRFIDGGGIEEAWADLQQLPIAWNEPPTITQSSNGDAVDDMIEFGSLDDTCDVGNTSESMEYDFEGDFEVASNPGPATETLEQPLTTTEEENSAAEASTTRKADADPTNRIDEIERHFESLERDPNAQPIAEQPKPEVSPPEVEATPVRARTRGGTEVELVVHGPPNPFAEPFEHEEQVSSRRIPLDEVDSGTTVSVRILRNDDENDDEANTSSESTPPDPAIDRPPKLSIAREAQPAPDVVEPEESTAQPVDAATRDTVDEDPVLPAEQMPTEVANLVRDAKAINPAEQPTRPGDRDMLEIEEEEPRIKVQQPRGARRTSYRKIFTSLRKLQA